MAIELLTPVQTGIKNINYFEGRLLTARDLREQEEANRELRWSLGKAIGAGVVEGMRLTIENRGGNGTVPVVKVASGIAINAEGQVLELAGDSYKIALSKTQDELALNGGIFRVCGGPPDTKQIPNGSGIFLLIISPTATYQDFAPKSGLLAAGDNPECGRRYVAEGLQFRLEQLHTTQFDEIETPLALLESLGDSATDAEVFKAISQLRNGVAHSFFKSVSAEAVSDKIRDTESAAFARSYSALDLLVDNELLTDCDVPLALLYWDQTGIRFLDTWSVRRLARRLPPTDDISLLQTYGLERFLQFQDHIDELLESSLVLEQFEIKDLFRYVPPAAYIPVKGANSDDGFDTNDFIQTYFRPPLNEISAGLFADVLRKSLHLPAVDLQTHAYLHTYRLVENEFALDQEESNQRFFVICGNSTKDIRIGDGLVVAFETAWSVYGGLLKRRVFVPPATDPEKIVAVNSITHSIRNVMDMANRQASIAASNVLNHKAALRAYRWLYDAQSELAEFLQSNIPGITDTQDREAFGAALERLLDDSLIDGAPGLYPALQAENLVAAIDAQDAINSFVGSWSGEGIALGPFGIFSPNRPQGSILVPEADPIPVVFTLYNGTDKTLTFDLQAELEPTDAYPQPTILKEIGGDEIDSWRLTSGASARIVAMVAAPALNGVSLGDRPSLIMTASIPAPTSRTSRNEYPDLLEVGDSEGDPEEGLLTFVDPPVSFVPSTTDPGNVVVGEPFSIVLNAHYENQNTTPRTFTVDVTVTARTASTEITGWHFATPIDLADAEETIVDVDQRIYRYDLENKTPSTLPLEYVGVGVIAVESDATDIDINIAIRSTDSEPPISAEYGVPISLSMA